MKQTALMQLIDEMTEYLNLHPSPEVREILRILKASAIRKYQKEEKEQIVSAYKQGYGIAYIDGDNKNFEEAVKYYNETFSTKEKQSVDFEIESQPTLHWDSLPTPNEINKRMKKNENNK